jgi:hypothetical protein
MDIDIVTGSNTPNLQLMDSYSDHALRLHLATISEDLAKPEICTPCWIHNKEFQHSMGGCTKEALGYLNFGSRFKSWKSKFNLPTGMCFNCCIPQVCVLLLLQV